MKIFKSFLLAFVLLFVTSNVSANNDFVQYTSPPRNAQYVPNVAIIVVRVAPDAVGRGVIDFTIVGSKSGRHIPQVATDKAGIFNLTSSRAFTSNETVSVTVRVNGAADDYSWNFTTAIQPTDDMVIRNEVIYSKEVDGSRVADAVLMPPSDLPTLNITTSKNPAPGSMLISPNSRVANPPYAGYLQVLDSVGVTQLWQKIDNGFAFDYRNLVDGRLAYTLFQAAGSGALASSIITIVDTNLQAVKTVKSANSYNIAMHGFTTLPNGNRVVMCQENLIIDMASIVPGGNPAASVQQALIQEITSEGILVFQWRSLDNLPITASYEDLTAATIRYIHNNSVFPDTDGNYLLSLRHMSAVAKINRNTGETMWVLGGKLNQFTFSQGAGITEPAEFSYQHDIRRLPNGNITVFDNGTSRSPKYSRAVEYKLDEQAKTCELVWTYRHSPDVYVSLQGAVQTLDNNNRIIAWGSAVLDSAPAITEVNSNGEVVLEGYYPKMMYPYKVEKINFPTGRKAAHVLVEEILSGNTYAYSDADDTVGVTVTWHTVESVFYNATTGKRYMFSPVDPLFRSASGMPVVPPVLFPVRVTMEQEGMTQHKGAFRFNARVVGLLDVASEVKVYYRDTIGSGHFVEQKTNYNPNSGEIIVDTLDVGEYAFGFTSPSTIESHAARLTTPINGKRVLKNSKIQLRCSPQGVVTHHRYVVMNPAGDLVRDVVSKGDKDTVILLEEGMYTWKVESWYQNGVDTISNVSITAIDSFMVTDPFIEVTRPSTSVVWTIDSSYAIGWETNVVGTVRIELMKGETVVVSIIDSIPVATRGYLWKVPFSVAPDTGYSIRVRTREVDTLNLADNSEMTIEIKAPTSSVEEDVSNAFTIAPNPAAGQVYIGGSEEITNVSLFTYSGEQVLSVKVTGTGTQINTTELAPGMYFVLLESNGRTVLKKLMINR